ncbi:MAG: IS3 family transposase [Ruoffia tabacinasalis]
MVKSSTATYRIALKKIMVFIQEAHETCNGIYGYRRRTIYLNHFQQAAVNHKCV